MVYGGSKKKCAQGRGRGSATFWLKSFENGDAQGQGGGEKREARNNGKKPKRATINYGERTKKGGYFASRFDTFRETPELDL